MKKTLAVVSLVIAATSAAHADTAKKHAPPPPAKKAPARIAAADEYFGRLKMSILGIANTIRDQTARYARDPASLQAEMGTIALAEDAIHDWEKKYPEDTWIPRTLFKLERFYQQIPTDECRGRAKATMAWIVRDYPRSGQAKVARQEIAQGRVGAPPAPPTDVAGTATTPAPTLGTAAPIDIAKPVIGPSAVNPPAASAAPPAAGSPAPAVPSSSAPAKS